MKVFWVWAKTQSGSNIGRYRIEIDTDDSECTLELLGKDDILTIEKEDLK